VLALGLRWLLLIGWVAWWLWGVNWSKAWPVLARGAWVPLLLALVFVALVWSRLEPTPYEGIPGVTVPNFWWQLVAVSLLAGVALICGWLQGVLGWAPAEVDLEPPAPSHGHGHAHH
jgi:hypothetical protein